ncbi:MAG: hypothetical protein IJ783_02590 [Kiritimatiellae bacterium]|nr:hypothetical protein [Kiritimatiellia bacterium]
MALTLTENDIDASGFEDVGPLRALCEAVAQRAAAVSYVPRVCGDMPDIGRPPRISVLASLVADVRALAGLYVDLGADYALGSYGTESSIVPLVHDHTPPDSQGTIGGYRSAIGFPRPLSENSALLAARPLGASPGTLHTFSEGAFQTCWKATLGACLAWLRAMRYVSAADWTYTHGLVLETRDVNGVHESKVLRPDGETGLASIGGTVGEGGVLYAFDEYRAFYSGERRETAGGGVLHDRSFHDCAPLDFIVRNPAPYEAYVLWVPCRGGEAAELPLIRTTEEKQDDPEQFTGHGQSAERTMIHGQWLETERTSWTVDREEDGANVRRTTGARTVYTADGRPVRGEPISRVKRAILVLYDSASLVEHNEYGWKVPNPFYNRVPPDDGTVHGENTTDEYLPVATLSTDFATGPVRPNGRHAPFGEWRGGAARPVIDTRPVVDVTTYEPGRLHEAVTYDLRTKIVPIFDYGPAFGIAEPPVTLESETERASEWRLKG